MDKRTYRYYVHYEYFPQPMSIPKTDAEILLALHNFKSDVEHHLFDDPRAVATVGEPSPEKIMAVAIETTATAEEVEAAVRSSCIGLGLCARQVGSPGIP